MTKVINVDESKNQVEVICSNKDVLKKWAENCNCTSINFVLGIQYKVNFENQEDMKYFAAQVSVNCK